MDDKNFNFNSTLLFQPNIYIRHNHTPYRLLLVALHVDNNLILGAPSKFSQVKLDISKGFSVIDLGSPSFS